MKNVLLICMLGLLMTIPAQASEVWLHVVIGTTGAADLTTTLLAVDRGFAVEANPLMKHRSGAIALKAGTLTLEMFAVHKLWKDGHKWGAVGTTIGLVGLNGWMTYRNLRNGRFIK